jgi:hypothetical protein
MAQPKPLLSFSELSSIASNLNKTSNEFAKVIEDLNIGLQRLNVGVGAWFTVNRYEDPEDARAYELEQIGYNKIRGQWGLCIREAQGHEDADVDRTVNMYRFNEAPRDLRIRCAEKLPELVDRLARAAINTTELMAKRLAEAKAVAAAINVLSPVVDAGVLGPIGGVKK